MARGDGVAAVASVAGGASLSIEPATGEIWYLTFFGNGLTTGTPSAGLYLKDTAASTNGAVNLFAVADNYLALDEVLINDTVSLVLTNTSGNAADFGYSGCKYS